MLTKMRLESHLKMEGECKETVKEIFVSWRRAEDELKEKIKLRGISPNFLFNRIAENTNDTNNQIGNSNQSEMEKVLRAEEKAQETLLQSILPPPLPPRRSSTCFREVVVEGNEWEKSTQVSIWLNVAECLIELSNFKEAAECIKEAKLRDPLSADVLYMEGYYKEVSSLHRLHSSTCPPSQLLPPQIVSELQEQYEKALTINSHHSLSKYRLGMLYLHQHQYLLAENYFTSIIREDPTDFSAWFSLGLVLKQKPNPELDRASECFVTSLQLEETSPIRPFSIFVAQI